MRDSWLHNWEILQQEDTKYRWKQLAYIRAIGGSEEIQAYVVQATSIEHIDTGWWKTLIAEYFPPFEVERALRVSYCESKWRDVISTSGDWGRFQINQIHSYRVNGDLASLLNPEVNVRIAYEIWRDNGGWGPWNNSRYCWA